MEGLRISCTRSTYDVIVVWKLFDDYVRTSVDANLEGEFH